MSVVWLKINERLLNGINLINFISTTKFVLLLKRIIKHTSKDKIFTDEELKKLEESLNLNISNVQLLIQSLFYIYKQASKIILKPTDLHKQLTDDLKIDKEKADEFIKVWSEDIKNQFPDLENRMLLEKMSWQINLEAGSSFNYQELNTTATVQLNLSSLKDKSKENITLELDEDELIHFYTTLENIQAKLDSL